ncbi:hypothetical protein QQ045_007846 [Rhodiola kirilowii]
MSKDVMEDDRMMSRPVTEAVAASDRGAESERTMLTSMSGVKKVRIKIKMPERSCCESHEQQLEDDRMRKERDQAVEVVAEEERHVCVLCGKGFRSGKALGGHMRVHSQRERNDELEIAGVERAAAATASSAAGGGGGSSEMDDEHDELKMRSGGKPMCPICGKDFPSNKALFGHMRCHPERNWRGIQPPVYSSSSTVSDVQAQSDDDVNDCGDDDNGLKELKIKNYIVDLAKELEDFGWGTKAMRGREAAVKSCTSSRPAGCPVVGFRNLVVESSSLPPDQAAGVQNLLFLSRGGVDDIKSGFSDHLADQSCGSYKEEKKRRSSQVLTAEEIMSGLTISAKKKLKVDNNKVAAGAHDLKEFDPSPPPNWAYGNAIKGALAGVYNAAELIMQEDKKVHKVRKYLMVNDLTANHPHSSPVNKPATTATALHHEINLKVQESEGYKCTTCNKSFTSHQALGGHKSSHNKLRNGPGFKNNDHPHNQEKNVIPQGCYDNSVVHVHGGASLNYGVKMGAIPTTSAHPLLHQCNVCFKIYPTGQALGGHKRLHCSSAISKTQLHLPIMRVIPEPQAAHPPPPAAPLPAGQASDNAREVCKFDLNELPSVEVDGHHEDQDAIVNSTSL